MKAEPVFSGMIILIYQVIRYTNMEKNMNIHEKCKDTIAI
ncbi:hypothetical protein BRYFOR_06126 [Marvinbryantia formatexigens DSM 14469]|uniref:Uncharacterized protein n=1 Tax=Marvinbryantia formatexigens DSM 14469 TaxID=478749 RepID=C6LBY1_9FIRM|nr:hypothetical protein BRYFOR_06126 [Marvinbryantia formatexigens DSM 14469]SDF34501.1 hypothetical protein SAMN05660368_00524 [Marvinbryantia formatexigens]